MSNKTAEIQCPTCKKSSFTDPEKAKEWQGLEEQLKVARETLVKSQKMFKEQGHCPWFEINEVYDCENCNDDCILPVIEQTLTQLRGQKQ